MIKKTVIVFLALLLCFWTAVSEIDRKQQTEGKQQLENALRRAAVSCYAAEGFYPPDVAYMQKHYGLQFDEETYLVRYELVAANWMPDITVLERSS